MLSLVYQDPTFAIIPTFVIVGPLALLAMLLPALFGGTALVLRRWRWLLTIAGVDSLLYLLHAWFRGYLKSWQCDSPQALWGTLALVTLVGLVWSWKRERSAFQGNLETVRLPPSRSEQIILWSVSLAGLAFVLVSVARGVLLDSQWKDLLAIWVTTWSGTIYALCLRFTPPRTRAPRTDTVMLWALVLTCAGLAATGRPVSLPEAVQVIWTFEPEQRGAIISTPFVADDRIYVGIIRDTGFTSTGAVYCLERHTGKELWQFDNDGKMLHMYSSPCLADGRLYIGEGMHANLVCKLYCLDAASGRALWHFETAGHIESSPCVAQGKVFFGAGDDGVYCLDAESGVQHWHFHGPFHVDTSPTVVGRRLYFGSGISRLHKTPEACCLDVENGTVLWRLPTDLPIWGSPAVAGDQVFFGLGNGRLVESAQPPEKPAGALLCLNANTGEVCWRYDVADAVHAKPAVDEGQVYFGARDGGCYCLDRRDGRLSWRGELGSPIVTTPALIDGRLYMVGSAGRVACLETETGKTTWALDLAQSTQTKPRLFSSPVAIAAGAAKSGHRRLYFGSELRSPVSSAAVLYCLED